MSEGVTPIRKGFITETPSQMQRIIDLQKALKAETDLMAAGVARDLVLIQGRLVDAVSHVDNPGVREEFRKLAETIKASCQRIDAIRGR